VPIERPADAGPVDAGNDGGPPVDAGTDAGPTDAGSDAGTDGGSGCTSAADCVAPNVATAGCETGTCTIVACTTGFDDCDLDFATGCEQDVSGDPNNCGVCGGACGLGGVCTAGACDTVVDVSVGFNHFCVVRSSGTVLCMGGNFYGQLGRGATSTRETTLGPVAMLSDATGVDVGAAVSCFERPGGTVACAGDDGLGQIGDGGAPGGLVSVPTAVPGIADLVEISVGGDFRRNMSGFPTAATEVGGVCARRTGGAVACWGSALMRGDGVAAIATSPTVVPSLTAVDVSAGHRHVCAVRTDNTVACWGEAGPRLGPTALGDAPTPVSVTGITDATHVDAGSLHTCARRSTGAVACWGRGPSGQLGATVAGDTSATPVAVVGVTDAVDVDVDEFVSCALRASGQVSCWGDNSGGNLGDGTTGAGGPTPVTASGLGDATALTVGRGRACVRRANGAVACWGGAGTDYGVTGDFSTWSSPTDHPDFPATPTP
jgi:hypothetical protein